MGDYFDDNDIDEIVPHVYVSNWTTSNTPDTYEKYNIRAVITLETSPKPDFILRYYEQKGIQYTFYYIQDRSTADITQFFDESYELIRYYTSRGQNVLVHCAAGVSRSVSIVLHYMIRTMLETHVHTDKNATDILNYVLYVAKQRRNINPNNGFLQQLFYRTREYLIR